MLEENNIHSVLIPVAFTGELQPMDISVNKSGEVFHPQQVFRLIYRAGDGVVLQ